MTNAALVATLVLREASRRRLLLAIALATLAIVALSALGFDRLAHAHDRFGRPPSHFALMAGSAALTIVLAFMFSAILSFGAAFLGALSLGSEIENGTLLAIVPRPLRRVEYFAGKVLGNALLLALYAIAIAGAEFWVIGATTGYHPPHPALAVAYLIAQTLLTLVLAGTLAVLLPPAAAGFLAVVAFGVAWISGIVATAAAAFDNATLREATVALGLLLPSDGLWRGAAFALEPAAFAATAGDPRIGNPFIAAAPPTTPLLLWTLGWAVTVALAGALAFRRRDL